MRRRVVSPRPRGIGLGSGGTAAGIGNVNSPKPGGEWPGAAGGA